MKISLSVLQDETPGDFAILKGQIPDVIDEEQEFGGKVLNLPGEVIMSTRF